MTEAAAVEVPEQTSTDAQSDADFDAGFNSGAVAEAIDDPALKTDQPGESDPTKGEQAADVKPTLIAGMSEEEWTAAVAKAAGPLVEAARAETRKNFGQIGELKKTLNSISERIAAGGSTGSARKITAEALKRVNEELPGLGDALAQDLAAIFESPALQAEADKAQVAAEAKGQEFDPEAFFAQKIGPALAELEARANEKAELRIVKSMHRDFETVVQSPEFSSWLVTLPADRQKTIRESDDGFVAADAVTEFKAWRDKATKKQADKTNRLESALTPSGDKRQSSHVTNDEEAEFERGFKSVK